MNSYGDFALIYDLLTEDVDYKRRCDYIEEIFVRHSKTKPTLVADLACGTGSMCTFLADRGYDMTGIDSSPQMLSVAASKSEGKGILYINQDICDFELYGTMDAFLCLLDSVNHLTEDGDLDALFALTHNYLNPEGIFVFDVNTEYKFSKILSDNIYTYEKDGVFYVWENDYSDGICDMYVNFFKEEDGMYRRIEQSHSERYYSEEEIRQTAQRHGFSVEGVYDELTFSPPTDTSQRQFWVLKKI